MHWNCPKFIRHILMDFGRMKTDNILDAWQNRQYYKKLKSKETGFDHTGT